MHSVNVVFLLGEAALNCLVSCSARPKLGQLAFHGLQLLIIHALSLRLKYISAVSLFSNCIFLLVDNCICYFPVDLTLSFVNLVRNSSL